VNFYSPQKLILGGAGVSDEGDIFSLRYLGKRFS
jgi:hypothetical protein